MERLKDKVAIVSGGAKGIGRAICEVFAEEGAWVLVTDVDAGAAEETSAAIRKCGGTAEACRVDVGNLEQIEFAVKMVTDKWGKVDVLCNNAAYIGPWHDIVNGTAEEWAGCLQTTLMGTQNFTRAVLPWMIKGKQGSIIITSSVQGLVACPNSASYTTVKAGLIGFAKSAACDYGKYNIRVNAVCPGPIKVAYSPSPGQPAYDYQIRNTFLGRVGATREVAYPVLFLASNESSFITGTVLPIDGGWTAM